MDRKDLATQRLHSAIKEYQRQLQQSFIELIWPRIEAYGLNSAWLEATQLSSHTIVADLDAGAAKALVQVPLPETCTLGEALPILGRVAIDRSKRSSQLEQVQRCASHNWHADYILTFWHRRFRPESAELLSAALLLGPERYDSLARELMLPHHAFRDEGKRLYMHTVQKVIEDEHLLEAMLAEFTFEDPHFAAIKVKEEDARRLAATFNPAQDDFVERLRSRIRSNRVQYKPYRRYELYNPLNDDTVDGSGLSIFEMLVTANQAVPLTPTEEELTVLIENATSDRRRGKDHYAHRELILFWSNRLALSPLALDSPRQIVAELDPYVRRLLVLGRFENLPLPGTQAAPPEPSELVAV